MPRHFDPIARPFEKPRFTIPLSKNVLQALGDRSAEELVRDSVAVLRIFGVQSDSEWTVVRIA